jgi:ribosomal protein S6--L-glutamate ligase/tetrahydromethanopterin:alpha-L-glutamate ligase
MKFGLLTRNSEAWCSSQLANVIRMKRIDLVCFRFSDVLARVACKPQAEIKNHDVYGTMDAVLVRPIGRGSLDEIIFRLDLLHRLKRLGITVVNPPSAIEKAVDKYYALTLLEEKGISVPRTIVTESPRRALRAFQELGEDVVIKPLFGSRGMGITRVTDFEIARRIFRSLAFLHHVLYVQEFIPHGNRDIRAFVVGDEVVAAMYRVADNWRTNVSQGAKTVAFQPSDKLQKIAVTATKILGCEIAGVDVMEGPSGYVINEINSQPGFKGLQSTTHVNIAEAMINHLITICS